MDAPSLRQRGERLLAALARSRHAVFAGHAAGFSHTRLYSDFSDVCSSEAVALAREGVQTAGDEEAGVRARRLWELVVRAIEGQRCARELDRLREAEAAAAPAFDAEPFPLAEAAERVGDEPLRERRAGIERAWRQALPALDPVLRRLVERRLELAASLEFPSYEALFVAVTGIDLANLAAEAERVLQSSEDAWRDLAGFALRRLVGPIAPRPRGDAGWADLERSSRCARYDDLFRERRLVAVAQHFLESIGLAPDAGGRIEVDLDRRPGKRPGAAAFAFGIPEDIALAARLRDGAPAWRSLFDALGRAQRLAAIAPEAPFEESRLSDGSLDHAAGLLFAHRLCEPEFLQRFLGAAGADAVEAARMNAIHELGELRRDCARLVYERVLYKEGPRDELRGFYRERLQAASLAEWPLEPWLVETEPWFEPARRLRGRALEESLRGHLLERADEDWWRNPRTGSLFRRWLADGRPDAVRLAEALGSPLSLERTAARLIDLAAR